MRSPKVNWNGSEVWKGSNSTCHVLTTGRRSFKYSCSPSSALGQARSRVSIFAAVTLFNMSLVPGPLRLDDMRNRNLMSPVAPLIAITHVV